MQERETVTITPADVGELAAEVLAHRTVFCAREQKPTPHYIRITPAEVIFTCACGAFVKFRADLPYGRIAELLVAHEAQNKGQVRAPSRREIAERIRALADGN